MPKYLIILLILNYWAIIKCNSSILCYHRTPKIVGGFEAAKSEFPFIVSLMRRGGHFCGATILSERWILTAGHCICNGLNKFMKPTQIEGIIGLHSISKYTNSINKTKTESNVPISVKFNRFFPHPLYKCSDVKHDIALLELLESITFSSSIQPTHLPIDENSVDDEEATVSGWGWTKENQENGQRADILQKAVVKIWNNDMCNKSYKLNGKPDNVISETQLCAGFENGGIDSCWADSGGPLISSKNILVGIVSTGVGCARPGLPGIYTRISKYTLWITSTILKN